MRYIFYNTHNKRKNNDTYYKIVIKDSWTYNNIKNELKVWNQQSKENYVQYQMTKETRERCEKFTRFIEWLIGRQSEFKVGYALFCKEIKFRMLTLKYLSLQANCLTDWSENVMIHFIQFNQLRCTGS